MWRVLCLQLLMFPLASLGTDILVVSEKGVVLHNTTSGNQQRLMQDNVLMLKEVDYHYSKKEVYGLTKRQIIKGSLLAADSFKHEPVVYSEDEYNFMSLTIDWVHDRLYWVAGPVFMIHKAMLNGSDHRVVFRGYYIENFHRKLLVDPYAKLLIWATTNKIFKADLNGKNLEEIKFPEILGSVKSVVRNLAVDVTRQRVYYLAGFEDDDVWMLMSGKYDGSEFRRHDSVSRFTYALAAMGNELYWVSKEFFRTALSDGEFKNSHTVSLYRANTDVPGSSQKVLDLKTGAVWNIKVCDAGFQTQRLK